MTKKINYEDLLAQIEAIAQQMESGQIDIDSMAKNIAKAKKLIAECEAKLTTVEEDIKKISAKP